MKRYGDLKKYWCTYESLLNAFKEVRKNKSYHRAILLYENNLAVNLEVLLKKLEDETYCVRPSRVFYVHDPKTRLIEAPNLEDRIVQHALLNATRKIIENRFVSCTYACRVGKGTHNASDQLKKYLLNYKNVGYYLKVDIEKFFYSIDHNVLIGQLKKIIKCKPTLDLLIKFFENETGKGLPLGSVTSQILANLALNPIDQLIKRKLHIKHFIRYMDDFVLLAESKRQLIYCLQKIKELAGQLKLVCNRKTIIGKIKNGIDFVGFRTWFNLRIIRKRSLYKIRRVLKKNADVNRVSSFLAHAKKTNSLFYIANLIIKLCPQFLEFIKKWLFKNNWRTYNVLFQN